MTGEVEKEILQAFKDVWIPPDDSEIFEWANKHIKLKAPFAFTGKFDVTLSPYLIQPFKDLKNNRIREVNAMAGVKTGKTLLAQIWLPWIVCNAPGALLWLMQAEQASDLMSETKTLPILTDCPPVAVHLPKDRNKIRKDEIIFPHMPVTLTSAKESMLQSTDCRYVIMDEPYLYKEGFINQGSKRVRAHLHHSKILRISQGPDPNTEWDTFFKKGKVFEWGWFCPECKREQVHRWQCLREDGTYSGMNWLKDDTTYPNGVRNNSACAKTAHLECHFCKHKLFDTEANRHYLNTHGLYINTKADGDDTINSYRWPSWAFYKIPFETLVLQYLQARDLADLEHNFVPLNDFYKQELGQPKPLDDRNTVVPIAIEDYDPNVKWTMEEKRFMSIDIHRSDPRFYYVVRAWAKNGDSRLITHGTCNGWEELRNVQKLHEVKDQCVVIDCGDSDSRDEVFEHCVDYGHEGLSGGKKTYFCWNALRGESSDHGDGYSTHSDGIKRAYAPVIYKPVLNPKYKGKTCPYIAWKNTEVKNILNHLRRGKSSIKWVANKVSDAYEQHMNAEQLIRERSKKTGKEILRWKPIPDNAPNHYFDAECLQIVAALASQILGKVGVEKEPPKMKESK